LPTAKGVRSGLPPRFILVPETARVLDAASRRRGEKAGDNFVTVERLWRGWRLSAIRGGQILAKGGVNSANNLNEALNALSKGRPPDQRDGGSNAYDG